MISYGPQYLDIYPQTGNLFFSGNMNILDSGSRPILHFSGSSDLLALKFERGRIYCNEDYVDSYVYNSTVLFSGYIGPNSYDLFIDGEPQIIGHPKETGTISTIFLDVSGYVGVNLFLNGKRPTWTASIPSVYSSTGTITGNLSCVPSDIPFQIYSGSIEYPYFNFSLPTTGYLTGTGYFNLTSNTVIIGENVIPTKLYTNFGLLEFSLKTTGISTGVQPVDSYIFISYLDTHVHNYNSGSGYLQVYSYSGDEFFVSLSYNSGSGITYTGVPAKQFITGQPVSGYITGSGSLYGDFGSGNDGYTNAYTYLTDAPPYSGLISGSGISCTGSYITGGFYIATGIQDVFWRSEIPYMYNFATAYIEWAGDPIGYTGYVNATITGWITGVEISGSKTIDFTYYYNNGGDPPQVYATGFATGGVFWWMDMDPPFTIHYATGATGIFTLGGPSGSCDFIVYATGYFTGNDGSGWLTGSGQIPKIIQTFTGSWDLSTGTSYGALIDYKSSGYYTESEFASPNGVSTPYNLTNFYLKINYNNYLSGNMLVNLLISGARTGYQTIISGVL